MDSENMLERHINFIKELSEQLNDEDTCIKYLSDALAKDMGGQQFGAALMAVLKARDINISDFATQSNVIRECLYRSLKHTNNPQFKSLQKILRGLGYEFCVRKI